MIVARLLIAADFMYYWVKFEWNYDFDKNVDHIRRHGMTVDLWEAVYHAQFAIEQDKDDATVTVGWGRVRKVYFIVYEILEVKIYPVSIKPITGYLAQ